jgi:hypothetical protein
MDLKSTGTFLFGGGGEGGMFIATRALFTDDRAANLDLSKALIVFSSIRGFFYVPHLKRHWT